ncbi:PDZ domain-containing protein [bacterium]|nr:PDZ domain-containing protein [bacterium]
MRAKTVRKAVFFSAASLLLVLGLVGLWRTRLRPGAGFQWKSRNAHVVLYNTTNPLLKSGDILAAIQGRQVTDSDHVEFVLDRLRAGDSIQIDIKREGKDHSIQTILTPRFSHTFQAINLLLGLFFWGIGIFVFWAKHDEHAARVFAWMSIVSGTAIIMIWPGRPYGHEWIGYLLPAMYFVLYPLIPGLICYFSAVYPDEKRIFKRFRWLYALLFVPGLVVMGLIEIGYFQAILQDDADRHRFFYSLFRSLHLLFTVGFISSLLCLVHSYFQAKTEANRNKVQWILWGTALGLTPFVFLWMLPQIFGFAPLIPNEVNYLAMMLVPLSVAFSIVRYRAMDIEIIINRSIVYTIVTGLIVILYLLVAGLASHYLHIISPGASHLLTILYTLFAALIFSPLKQRIQFFVDKTFYRIKFNYHLAIQALSQKLMTAHDRESALNLILDAMDEVIPTHCILIMHWNQARSKMILAGGRGISITNQKKYSLSKDHELLKQITKTGKAQIREGRDELAEEETFPARYIFPNIQIELVIPIFIQEKLEGLLLLGPKRSGLRFAADDLSLLTQMAVEGFMVLEHLRLQEAMIMERAEKEKHEMLSQLKSEFVSHVSHELRTPLASIEWAIQNLLDGIPEKPSQKIQNYLLGICESSRHLSRMIENLLDITSIEAGKVEIFPESLSVAEMIQQVVQSLKPLADKKQICLDDKTGTEMAVADRDCLQAVCTNLIDNAIKYSPPETTVRIETGSEEDRTVISIIDSGPGIPPEKKDLIFQRFERVRKDKGAREKGLGLGLHIVKKLVELQNGSICVESEAGKGSIFRLMLPKAG